MIKGKKHKRWNFQDDLRFAEGCHSHKQDAFYQVTIPLGSSLDWGSMAFTCIAGGVVSLTLDTDISLSSKMCGGVLDEDGGERDAES